MIEILEPSIDNQIRMVNQLLVFRSKQETFGTPQSQRAWNQMNPEWLQEKENPLLDGENAGVLYVDTSDDEMNVDDQSQQQNLSHSSSNATPSQRGDGPDGGGLSPIDDDDRQSGNGAEFRSSDRYGEQYVYTGSGHFRASSSIERSEPRARSKEKGKDTRKHTSEGSSSDRRLTSSNPSLKCTLRHQCITYLHLTCILLLKYILHLNYLKIKVKMLHFLDIFLDKDHRDQVEITLKVKVKDLIFLVIPLIGETATTQFLREIPLMKIVEHLDTVRWRARGEYRAAVKALEEAIFMKPDYSDAHCDLASALHGMGEDERAIEVFQKAIDLKPDHVDALYNLGGLYMDLGKFQRASEMYTRVLAVWPNHWQAQLNKAVSFLGVGETEEAKKALKEALKMTNRTFQRAVKAINEKVLSVLDETRSDRVDLGMFYVVLAPICNGPPDNRKMIAFDALLRWPVNEGHSQIRKVDVIQYIKLLLAIYIPSHGVSEMLEVHGETDTSMVSFSEFLVMFDDPDWGFGILSSLLKLETGDRNRHGNHVCSVCNYPIIDLL
ncbi:Detected protein of confused Function [Hibiscus syriacus]|uniref:Detected protein of confused Function n=1 Tax=Hibiscus syriacus TaxID=106335 RepID=A0A6A3BC12_HIBSY|nr:Detected protein of confused Function [Hibiscus syriacus]